MFASFDRGNPVGYLANGEPVYDGAVGILGYSYASIASGFIVYPILFFLVISMITRFSRRSQPLDSKETWA